MTFGSVPCSRTTGSPSASRFAYAVVEVRKLAAEPPESHADGDDLAENGDEDDME